MTPALDRETARAVELARASGAEVYVVEGVNDPPDEWPDPDAPTPTPDQILDLWEQDQRDVRDYQANPEAYIASGPLLAEDTAASPEQVALDAEREAEGADPSFFSARDGKTAAILVNMLGHGDFLRRVARPDGSVEPINDHDGEAKRLLQRYADYLDTLRRRREA